MLTLEEFVRKLPEDQQRRIKRGSRLFNYIIAKRCQQPEKLAGDAGDTARTGAEASPKARGVAGK